MRVFIVVLGFGRNTFSMSKIKEGPGSIPSKGTAPQRVARNAVTSVDDILGIPFRVLDDGFIRVVDYMGSDASIVQAARVSYGEGTKHVTEDRDLIRYLMRHSHTTPFEMCEIKLHVRVPMDCWRQWIRHRTANVNEYSTRYSVAIDSMQSTKTSEWRQQSSKNKQGSSGYLGERVGESLTEREKHLHSLSREIYEDRLKSGVAREQARKDLPLSTYTEAYWKLDLHNLFHFLRLRMAPEAQLEIREYANIIGNQIVSKWCPIAWEAFCDYQLSGVRLSDVELKIVAHLIAGRSEEAIREGIRGGLLKNGSNGLMMTREGLELESKLKRNKINLPWSE